MSVVRKSNTKSLIPYRLNILLLGNYGVGKSSIIIKFKDSVFSKEYIPTVEDKYKVVYTTKNDEKIDLTILDTAGFDGFITTHDYWIDESDAFILTYMINN
jgi:small GTP-binding protein